MNVSLNSLTITQIAKKLRDREISSVELTKAILNKIKKSDKEIHAFLNVAEDSALAQAKIIDEKIAAGENLSSLAGIPMAIKDNILVEGMPCTAGSKILEDYVAPYDATVTKKLKDLGAVIIGKTNLDEFAMGSSTENSAFGPTKNPHDLTRVPGGSSGGSAAAVAADECIYALGSDTGGSIRQPAAFCGVVGLKPTYGCVSRYGLIAMASSFDQIGPITKTVEDAKIVLDAISGNDEMDSTSIISPQKQKSALEIKKLKVGIPNEYFVELVRPNGHSGGGLDPKIEKIIREKILEMEKRGIEITGVSLPHTKYALACYYIIMPAEVSANLARYDGVKYGSSNPLRSDLLNAYLNTRGQGFGKEVKRRIMLGTFALSAGYYEAYYQKAQKIRMLIKKDFDRVFEKIDVLITPTVPTTAFKLGEKTQDPLAMYLSDIFTLSVNLVGLPAISVPCGKVDNLPVGLQIIGQPFKEETILKLAINL